MAIDDSEGMALDKPQTNSHNLALITTATKAKRRRYRQVCENDPSKINLFPNEETIIFAKI